ncbi:MAG: transcriptional regulator [Nitrospirales bacterium]|nr:MAG: transcriptional regulator [Nitrospirales bacterium]
MDKDGQRALFVLQEIEQNPVLTQRSLALKLGVALGLTNLYLKRLVRKGHIKITTIPKNRIRYLLTPRGLKEKSRLTYEYLQYSLTYYRDVRQRLNQTLADLSQLGKKRIVIYGVGELAEFAYLALQESDLTLVGFVSDELADSFLSFPCTNLESLQNWTFDAILISDLAHIETNRTKLLALHIPAENVFTVV